MKRSIIASVIALPLALGPGVAQAAESYDDISPMAYSDYTYPNGCKVQGGNGNGGLGKAWAETKKRNYCTEVRARLYAGTGSTYSWRDSGWTTGNLASVTANSSSDYYKKSEHGGKNGGAAQYFELLP